MVLLDPTRTPCVLNIRNYGIQNSNGVRISVIISELPFHIRYKRLHLFVLVIIIILLFNCPGVWSRLLGI